MNTVVVGKNSQVNISTDGPVVIVGEKINPSGHKKLLASLRNGNFDYVRKLAVSQVLAGAEILDINVGGPGLDDLLLMPQVVKCVIECVDVPLCLDSPSPEVLEAGLRVSPGRPLVNSVTGDDARLRAVLPLVKDNGLAVIGLTMDQRWIPDTAEGRLAIAYKIVDRAIKVGIPPNNMIIDPLALPLFSNTRASIVALEAINLIRRELGVNVIISASNVSYGLPDRLAINQAFMAMAISAGATCVFTDPAKMLGIVQATNLLLGREIY